ncbi:hypothetical protein IU821_004957, partial [Salmonella enterica]|nr:hypothetical protein [Salmonella enterica]
TDGDAVTVMNGSALDGTVVNGSADTGTGLNVAGDTTLSGATLHGTSVTGAGTAVSGHLVSDSATSVTGTSGSGDGLALNNGTLTGGKVAGHSQTGSGMVTSGHSRIDGAVVDATSSEGTGLDVRGQLEKTPGTTIGSSSSQGLDNIVTLTSSGVDADAAAVQIRQQQSAVAAVSAHGALPAPAGFAPGAVAPVPVQGYQAAAQTVDLSVCPDGRCQDLSMDITGPQSSDGQHKDRTQP